MTDINFVDGLQLEPLEFASGASGTWQPKRYHGRYGVFGWNVYGEGDISTYTPETSTITDIVESTNVWTGVNSAGETKSWQSVAYGNGLWVACSASSSGPAMAFSTSGGASWASRNSADDNCRWNGVAYGDPSGTGIYVSVADIWHYACAVVH